MHIIFCRWVLPNKLYTYLSQALLFCLICHTPIKNRGLSIDPWPFPTVLTMKTSKKKRHSHVQFILSDIILTRWWCPVASSKALDLVHRGMHAVLYRRTAAAINMATFLVVFFDCCLFACCPGSCWGDTAQVVAQWRCPVASGVALDMLHWAMHFILHRRTAMAIKMANVGGTCWYHHRFGHQQ